MPAWKETLPETDRWAIVRYLETLAQRRSTANGSATDDDVRVLNRWKARARRIKRDTHALYLACRDPRTPWYAKVFAAGVVAYALSPIDLIPDFIPVLGYLDDLILLPIGIALTVKLIPAAVMDEARAKAEIAARAPPSLTAATVIVLIWLVAAIFVAAYLARQFSR